VLVQHDAVRPLALDDGEDDAGVRRPGSRFDGIRRRISRFYFEDRIEPVTPAELAAAHHEHGDHEAIEAEEERPALPSGQA
jgi:ubiquinol-cytochrome c reductase cytochrome b subunit